MVKIIEFISLVILLSGVGRFILIEIFFDLQYLHYPKRYLPFLSLLIGLSKFSPFIAYMGAESFEEKGALSLWFTKWKWARYRLEKSGTSRTLTISQI